MSGNPLPPPTLQRASAPAERDASAWANGETRSRAFGALNFASPTPWLLALLLVVGTLLAYQPAWDAGFIWDDDDYVTNNPLLTAPDGWSRIWFSTDAPSQYFPLTYSVLRLEYGLWGFHSTGYHGVNLLLHVANALLVWRMLRRLAMPGAWLAAAIFALHPVQVESVAWVTELKNVLSLFFLLLALRAWVDFSDERGPRRGAWRWYVVSLGCAALALTAKTTACTLPAALVLVLWWRRQPITRARIAQIAPFLALGLGMGFLTLWWERTQQGTDGAVFGLGFSERVLIASRAVWFYLGKFLWPADLSFSYPRWTIEVTNPLAYSWIVAGLALAVGIALTRKRLGRALETGAVFFVAMLSPLLGFIMLYTFRYSFVADHYQYVALIAPAALAGALLFRCAGAADRRFAGAGFGVAGAILLTLGALTWKQAATYENRETLWRATLAVNPDSFLAHNNLSAELLAQERAGEAQVHAEAALLSRPTGPDLALVHVNLGNAHRLQHRATEAITHYRRAIEAQPDLADAHDNLGRALLDLEHTDAAIVSFETALRQQPDHANAHRNLGDALYRIGNYERAAQHYRRAALLRPYDAPLQNNLASAELQRGQAAEARTAFERAVELDPGYVTARRNLGYVLLHTDRAADAARHFRAVLLTERDDLGVATTLGWLLATSGDESVRNGGEALRLAQRLRILTNDRDPAALRVLAAAFAETRQFADAVTTAQRARKLADTVADPALGAALDADLACYAAGEFVRNAGLDPRAGGMVR